MCRLAHAVVGASHATSLSRIDGLKHEVSTSQTSGHIAERKHKPQGQRLRKVVG